MASPNITEPVRQRTESSRTAANDTATASSHNDSDAKKNHESGGLSSSHKSRIVNALDPTVGADVATAEASDAGRKVGSAKH